MAEQLKNNESEDGAADKIAEHYDKMYSENGVTFGQGKPEKIVEDILKYRNSGSVLELGAGEGRNSIFLAENGFEVTAEDISKVGIEKIKKVSQEKDLGIKTEIVDSRHLNLDSNFDVLVSTFMLHHLSYEEAIKLIREIQEHTNLKGLNAITVFTKNGDFFREDPKTDNFYPDEGELKEMYMGWEILEYNEVKRKAFGKKLDGSPIFNISAKILARKVSKK